MGIVMTSSMSRFSPSLIDVAVNLTDCVFRGVDWKKRRLHDDDFDLMLQRAQDAGVHRMIITGTSLAQSVKAIALCRRYPAGRLFCTVGVHPAHCGEFLRPLDRAQVEAFAADDTSISEPSWQHRNLTEKEEYDIAEERLDYLIGLIEKNRDVVVAVGEIGIDFAELSFCPREVQYKYFVRQLTKFLPLGLPFLFHSRECGMNFVDHLRPFTTGAASSTLQPATSPLRGVVHSFNGTKEEQNELLDMGLYLSVNGSAFREKDLANQVAQIPLNRLMLETDAPWCDIRENDYSYPFITTKYSTTRRKKKFQMGTCLERRNEPCHLINVLEAYVGCCAAAAMQIQDTTTASLPTTTVLSPTKQEVITAVYDNCKALFTSLQ